MLARGPGAAPLLRVLPSQLDDELDLRTGDDNPLCYYEFKFVEQLVAILEAHLPQYEHGTCPHVEDVLRNRIRCSAAELTFPDIQLYIGYAALFLLYQCQLMVRFVDDLTSGPNAYLPLLLSYSENTVST